MTKASKIEWVVEVVGKDGNVSYKQRKNREVARKFKNTQKARGNQARIIRNEYELASVSVVR